MVSTGLVTRSSAAMEMDTPSQILVKSSKVDPEKLGVWCKELIKEGTRFGPFVGEKAYEVDDTMDPAYIWEIVDVETKEFLFYINATNPSSGNWMRHIKCARFFEEQNIVSEQEGIDIFYQAIKNISPGEELLTWFEKSPLRRRKGKRRSYPNIKRAKTGKAKAENVRQTTAVTKTDSYADVNYVSQRGRKRSVKKYWQLDAVTDSDANRDEKLDDSEEESFQEVSDEDWETKEVKQNIKNNIEKPVKSGLPVENRYFQFDLQVTHSSKNRLGRKVFQCDICSGVYQHSFSLKRHYIRNHISYKYVSKVDKVNCSIATEADQLLEDEREDAEVEEKLADSDSGNAGEIEKCESIAGDEYMDNMEDIDIPHEPVLKVSEGDIEAKESGLNEKDSLNSRRIQLKQDPITTVEATDVEEKCFSSQVKEENNVVVQSDDVIEESQKSEKDSQNGGAEGDRETVIKYLLPGLYRCNICEQVFDTANELKEHFRGHPNSPNDKKFACEHCKMKFKHRQNLMRHEVVHTGAKPYICNHCNKRFPTLTNQKRHERIHKGQKFLCSQCPGTFTQTGDLKKHMCKQHPETYNECAYCSKYFSSESSLASHLHKVHNKDLESNHQKISARKKAHKVSLEKDRAESRRLASDQMESHSRSDPSLQFACTICRKRFCDYSNMCRHRRLAHEREASNVDSQWGNGDEVTNNDGDTLYSDTDSQPDGEKMDALQMYFSHVSHNISNNLQHFIEGKEEQLTKASSHIKWKQKKLAISDKMAEIKLEEFNFPQGFHIRQLSELYESPVLKDSVSVENDATPEQSLQNLSNTNSECLSENTVDINAKTTETTKTEDSPAEDSESKCLTLRVPEIKTCTLCHSVFHNNAALTDHMSSKHSQSHCDDLELSKLRSESVSGESAEDDCKPMNYSTKSDDVDKTQTYEAVVTNEQPLDLSAASTVLIEDVPKEDTKQELTEPEKMTETATQCSASKSGKKFLCLVCFLEFFDRVDLTDHQTKQHASVDCRHVEVDLNFSATWCKQPNLVGALNVSSSQLPNQLEGQSSADVPYLCTKCKHQFQSCTSLHQHIAECGDYWRHLNTRVTWVFVLRGSELPMEKVKKRGKFHWSNSPEELSRRQLQKMLLQQHLGVAHSDGTNASSRGRFGRSMSRHKSLESIDDDNDLRRNRWRHQATYNPRRHVRRREMAELVDVQKCRGCAEEFKTILQLERHIPICVEKNRIKDMHAEKTENGENSDEENDYDPNKHMCIYCERQFTYLRMLKKHVSENCSVRKEFVEKGEYIDEEWEQEIASKLQSSSRDSGQNFIEPIPVDDVDGTPDGKRGKRRKRGNNWGCRVKAKKSFKSSKSSDDGDSLFGWEDAFLSTWVKNNGTPVLKNSSTSSDKNIDGLVSLSSLAPPDQAFPVLANADTSIEVNGNPGNGISEDLSEPVTDEINSAGDVDVQLVETSTLATEDLKENIQTTFQDCFYEDTYQQLDKSPEPDAVKPETVAVDRCSTPQAEDETLTTDIKQKLLSKIQSKQIAKAEHIQVTGDVVMGKAQSVDTEPEGQNRMDSKDEGIIGPMEDEIVKEESAVEEQDNVENEEEEVQNTKSRKRRGPRLTMKSKKRKNNNPVVQNTKLISKSKRKSSD